MIIALDIPGETPGDDLNRLEEQVQDVLDAVCPTWKPCVLLENPFWDTPELRAKVQAILNQQGLA
jgi:hypothetical protein